MKTADGLAVLTISSQSKERIKVPVRAEESGAVVDPTATVPKFAFLSVGVDPTGSTSWINGDWETITGPPVTYKARVVIGPGTSAALTEGFYDMWIRITQGAEDMMRKVGSLIII